LLLQPLQASQGGALLILGRRIRLTAAISVYSDGVPDASIAVNSAHCGEVTGFAAALAYASFATASIPPHASLYKNAAAAQH